MNFESQSFELALLFRCWIVRKENWDISPRVTQASASRGGHRVGATHRDNQHVRCDEVVQHRVGRFGGRQTMNRGTLAQTTGRGIDPALPIEDLHDREMLRARVRRREGRLIAVPPRHVLGPFVSVPEELKSTRGVGIPACRRCRRGRSRGRFGARRCFRRS